MSYIKRLFKRNTVKPPPVLGISGGGTAFVAPPMIDAYQRIWGVPQLEDLNRYYTIYYTTPYVKSSIDMMANMVVKSGFEFRGGKPEVVEYFNMLTKTLKLNTKLEEIVRLSLVYGTSFTEIIYENPPETTPLEFLRSLVNIPSESSFISSTTVEGTLINEIYNEAMLEELNTRKDVGEPIALATLDPRYIRVLGDSKGRVWGFVQLITPLIYLRKYQILYHVNGRRSELYESYYGTSLIRSIMRIQTIINQLENDIALAIHYQAYPPIKAQVGNEKYRPTPEQENEIKNALESRKPGSNIIVPWFVNIEWMEQSPGVISRMEWFFRHLLREREQSLGIPRIFFGEVSGVSRTMGEILIQELERRIDDIRADPARGN